MQSRKHDDEKQRDEIGILACLTIKPEELAKFERKYPITDPQLPHSHTTIPTYINWTTIRSSNVRFFDAAKRHYEDIVQRKWAYSRLHDEFLTDETIQYGSSIDYAKLDRTDIGGEEVSDFDMTGLEDKILKEEEFIFYGLFSSQQDRLNITLEKIEKISSDLRRRTV